MTENKVSGFSPIGTATDREGKVIARDLFLGIRTKVYSLSVGTPAYIAEIKQKNERITDPDLKINENIFPIPEEVIAEFDQVYSAINKAPTEMLMPYLREQALDEDPSPPQG
jgi:hypothetical protein